MGMRRSLSPTRDPDNRPWPSTAPTPNGFTTGRGRSPQRPRRARVGRDRVARVGRGHRVTRVDGRAGSQDRSLSGNAAVPATAPGGPARPLWLRVAVRPPRSRPPRAPRLRGWGSVRVGRAARDCAHRADEMKAAPECRFRGRAACWRPRRWLAPSRRLRLSRAPASLVLVARSNTLSRRLEC